MSDIHDLLGKEVCISDKEGEITDILGTQYVKVDFFNVNDGSTSIHVKEVDEYLVE